MTVSAIIERAKAEAALHEAAVKIREILDTAAKEITLPDDGDVEARILELVTEDE